MPIQVLRLLNMMRRRRGEVMRIVKAVCKRVQDPSPLLYSMTIDEEYSEQTDTPPSPESEGDK
jgi:hypothetical protein